LYFLFCFLLCFYLCRNVGMYYYNNQRVRKQRNNCSCFAEEDYIRYYIVSGVETKSGNGAD